MSYPDPNSSPLGIRVPLGTPGFAWAVAHTRPRCEKKLMSHCGREGISATIPLHQSVKRYLSKTVVFEKPIFPGYVFLYLPVARWGHVSQNRYVANFLPVPNQTEFQQQLEDVYLALEASLEVRLAPEIGPGRPVRIRRGPLCGLHGWVEARYGVTTVLLRLDFIGQAAAVHMHADDLELL